MTLYNLFTDGQSNPCSLIFIFPVQPLEYNEYLLCILRIDTDTVILYPYNPIILSLFTENFNDRCFIAAKLYGIADQVLKKLNYL